MGKRPRCKLIIKLDGAHTRPGLYEKRKISHLGRKFAWPVRFLEILRLMIVLCRSWTLEQLEALTVQSTLLQVFYARGERAIVTRVCQREIKNVIEATNLTFRSGFQGHRTLFRGTWTFHYSNSSHLSCADIFFVFRGLFAINIWTENVKCKVMCWAIRKATWRAK